MSLTDGNQSNHLTERRENMPRAGKLKPIGVGSCLHEMTIPPTPPLVRKFGNSFQSGPGAIRDHREKANNPDVASNLVHGISTKSSISGGSLINPPQKTFFQQELEEVRQSVRSSRKKVPPFLPSWYNDTTTFGVKTVKGLDVGEIINPPKTLEEVEQEAQEGHEVYVRSHNAYFPGEKINRKYNLSHYDKDSRFGIQTPHFSDGRNLCKSLHWVGETLKLYDPNAPWKRSGNKENLAKALGKAVKPRINELNLPPDHTFGAALSSDHDGAGEIIHSMELELHAGSRDGRHGLLNAVRHHLKKLNFHNFPSLLTAFKHYDKKGKGMVDREDLQEVCRQFQLDVNETVLDDLMDYCDTDKDGHINFLEFANFLNWKDMMPVNLQEQSMLTNERQSEEHPHSLSLIKPEDLKPIESSSLLKTVRTLRRPQASLDHFKTSSSVIGAIGGTSQSRRYGIPSVRSDLPAPRMKRLGDNTSYSGSPAAADLLHPSVHALTGVYAEHLFCPRAKDQIADIFRNVGVSISEETFEEAWKLASMKQPDGEVCVETFRNVLKEIKAM